MRSTLLALAASAGGLWLAAEPPGHLSAAIQLVAHLDLQDTSYRHGDPRVTWQGRYQCHTDCSGFFDALLMHSYGYSRDDFKLWFDSHQPSARRYHDAIVGRRGFREIQHIEEVQPGDVLAVKYLHRADSTGHVMLVADPPRRIASKSPLVPGAEQWEVPVIDSSHSGHGTTDSRYHRGADGKDHDGLGRGVFRIYSTPEGRVAGFSWSMARVSKFIAPDDEHLVIGRLIPGFKPAR